MRKVSRAAKAVLLGIVLLIVPALVTAPPNPISSLSLSPTSVLGGGASTGTVTLASSAPSGGAVVTLTSSNTSVATVPVNVTVPAGQTSKTFAITTFPVGASTPVTITASYSSGTKTATLTVTPALLTSVGVSPASVSGGTASTGTVSLSGAAPAAGASVTLSSSNPSAASVPGTVTVFASSATFSITTFNVASSTNVTITAVYNGTTKTATLTVTPAPPALSGLSVDPATVVATSTANGTATLNQPAPTGGAIVALSSSDASVASVPSSITIPAGSTSGTFSVTTYSVPADSSVTISGSYGGVGKTGSLAVVSTFTLTLDNGSGPIYTNQSTVGIRGQVAPAAVGPSVLVRGTLGTQSVTATPAANGSFTLPNLTLSAGSNGVSVTGSAGSQSVGPVPATYVYDNVLPTASVVVSTNVPNPTNIATWTLSGTVSPYQGATENAFVYLNGGTTRFPIAANGTWSGSYTFVEGRNWIPFVVADLAGNYKNPPDYWDKQTFYLDTQGLKPVFYVGGFAAGSSFTYGWPILLDEAVSNYLVFSSESGASLNGSHLDLFFDEQGTFPALPPVSCAPDNLTCIVARKATPDMSLDFSPTTTVAAPQLSVGIHTIRMVLRDPFGRVYERGALLPVGWVDSNSYRTSLPLANFGTPGTVTTQKPKLVGRMVGGVAPIDCNDRPGTKLPAFSYWDPAQGGSWKTMTVGSTSVVGGVYQATPSSNIPVTTNAAGQKVLRIKLTEGVVKTNLYGVKYIEDTFGRSICNGQTVITDSLKPVVGYAYPYVPSDAGVFYDLPYRSSIGGDPTAPQIDASAIQGVSTDNGDPYTLSARFRITDLNGDLDARNVTIATAGCSLPACTYGARLAGDQLLTGTQPGGYFTVQLPLALGANNFVATARDDAAHVTNQSFTVNRNLTEVVAKIASPTTEGQSYFFCSPKTVTFDASSSVNRTNPPVSLRYQWTKPSWYLASNLATYTETVQYSDSRRVIVSSSAIPAPNPLISDPCGSAPAGKCSVATVNVQPFDVPTGTLPAQVLSPVGGASVRMDVSVTLDGSIGQNADPSYVYKWRLKRTSDGVFFAIPQATGTGSDPSYAVGNRTLTLRLDSISGVTAGNYTLFFDAAYQTPFGSCIAQQSTSSISITVTTKQYSATGLSPGAVVVGEGSTRLYGAGFDAAARVAISGPIYTLTNTSTPLCTMPSCPQVVVAAAASVDGTTLDFTTPDTLTPGIYLVFVSDPATGAASPALWLEVQPLQGSAPAKTQQFENIVRPLTGGQTMSGQFLAGRDSSGQFSDVDYYYFFATAGSTLNLSLVRSDTSLPWEAPDALDPQLTVIDPDGIVSQGFEAFDNQNGVDLNASLTNLVLPKTGRYTAYAATSKGFGPYQLSFTLAPVAPASGRQVIAASNNDRTVALNAPGLNPTALVFDPRGYPLSGATIQYQSTPDSNENGVVTFPAGSNVVTSARGFSQVDARLTHIGKISFEARLQNPGLIVLQQAVVTQGVHSIPSYAPIASVMSVEERLDPVTGELWMRSKPIERLEVAPGEQPVVAIKKDAKGQLVRHPAARVASSASLPQSFAAGALLRSAAISPETITTCTPATFRAAGVTEAVAGPFTVTLTDLTPKTGQTTGTEVIAFEGIHAHRVNKTIRVKIEIKDAGGAEPTYPVLVNLSLAGVPPGTLILDPDGARKECQSASFLWHERDAQGQIIAPNDEFEYRLTTRSAFVGVKPDPQNPGGVLPVWGTSEFLSVFFGTFDAADGRFTNQFSAKYGVHPEAGSPHHFKWNPTLAPPPHRREYLAAYDASFTGGETQTFTNNSSLANLYYLADLYDNTIYASTTTSATDPVSNVDVTFARQDPSDTTVNPAGYRLTIDWNDNPTGASPKTSSQWPNGDYVSTLDITGTDPETGPFNVSQTYTAAFSQPTFYSLVWVDGYDQPIDLKFDFSVNPPVPITFVSPGAARTRLNGELSRNSILLVTGTRLSWTSAAPVGWIGPPGTDPTLVTDGLDSFDVSLVDDDGKLVTDSEIQVAFCPLFNVGVLGPCPLGNRTSAGGVILGVRPIDRGYMGLIVSKAPTAPGLYFFRIKSLPSNVHPWRVGGSLDTENNYTYTYAVTVVSTEILDENLRRTNKTLNFSIDRLFYLRETDLQETASSYGVDLVLEDQDTHNEITLQGVTMRRLGRSHTFMSDAISLDSPDSPITGLSEETPSHPLGTMGIRSMAGTISPPPARYIVKDRRNREGTQVTTVLHLATTRLATILNATSNFDGARPGGPLGGGDPARDRIDGRVKWGANGYIATKLVNVDSDDTFTFDYWQGQAMTTDLRPDGLLASVEYGTKEEERVVPSDGSVFRALVGFDETVKPGLYRLRAKWALNPGSASSPILDVFCVTDRLQSEVCLNEWIISVGERVFLASDPEARNDLDQIYLPAVLDSRTSSAFLDAVANAATGLYESAGGNVFVSTDPQLLRPRLTHRIRRSYAIPDHCSEGGEQLHYGCTNNAARFPLIDSDLDLAAPSLTGIDLSAVYNGKARGRTPSGAEDWVDHLPTQPRNLTPDTWSTTNLSPRDIFFNRVVNIFTHETAHGFGLVSGRQYALHGAPTATPTMHAVRGTIDVSIQGLIWSESDRAGDLFHEPILAGESPLGPESWLMQTAPFRWHGREPQVADEYDEPDANRQVTKWLLFDHPLRFSLTSDFFSSTDRSIQQFFRERIPMCTVETRFCR